MTLGAQRLADAFEARTLDPAAFHHREHVAVAFALLGRRSFLRALNDYVDGVRDLATRAGAPEKFNLTITLAFMSLIAERRARSTTDDFDTFVSRNADLMTADALRPWYSRERLDSDLARRVFVMPDRRSARTRPPFCGASCKPL